MQKPRYFNKRQSSSPRGYQVPRPPVPRSPAGITSAPAAVAAPAAPAPDGAQVLNDIAAFIRCYLVCDDHQLTILTLWVACTQCHQHFSTAPYLHIRSAQPQSGKSLCINLLCDLANGDAPFTGVPGASLLERLLQGRSLDVLETTVPPNPCPVFIDDCQHSFGPSERQPVVCALACGSHWSGFFPWGDEDFTIFGPKALAGDCALPPSLAARCIPIHLRRPKPSEKFLCYQTVEETPDNLRARLYRWLQQVSPALAQTRKRLPADLPPTLTPGQTRIAEPLIHIADVAGESWPAKVRAALVPIFNLAESNPELQILSDIRSIFRDRNNPEHLASSDLLSQLRNIESRPWSAWTSKSGRRLATHLRPFGITSRRLLLGSAEDFMGYVRNDFLDAWDRYLPQLRCESDGAGCLSECVAPPPPAVEAAASASSMAREQTSYAVGAD